MILTVNRCTLDDTSDQHDNRAGKDAHPPSVTVSNHADEGRGTDAAQCDDGVQDAENGSSWFSKICTKESISSQRLMGMDKEKGCPLTGVPGWDCLKTIHHGTVKAKGNSRHQAAGDDEEIQPEKVAISVERRRLVRELKDSLV